jgi:hypothetical protein
MGQPSSTDGAASRSTKVILLAASVRRSVHAACGQRLVGPPLDQTDGERDMPESIILEFKGAGADQYHAVNKVLGIDVATGEGDWPPRLLSHTAAVTSDGDLVVYEIWESKAAQEEFMSRLGPALAEVGVAPPVRMEWFAVEGHYHKHVH